MVQRPGINLLNSAVAVVVGFLANLWLINSLGVIGAAVGILLPYVVLGILRHRTLRRVFGWQRPWSNLGPPILAALVASVPALICRALITGVAGQVISAVAFLLAYFAAWQYHRSRNCCER